MKPNLLATLIVTGVLSAPSLAEAQGQAAAELPRFDVAVSIGWFIGRASSAPVYASSWYNDSASRALTAGLYWTEHLKTAVEAQWSGDGEVYGSYTAGATTAGAIRSASSRLWTRGVLVEQQYQFGHNARVHPYLAAGAGMHWTNRETTLGPLYGPRGVIVDYGHTMPSATIHTPLLRIGAGFKGYVSERAFFRGDFRMAFDNVATNHVSLTAGFGVDF